MNHTLWLTYATYVEENDLEDCVLLTNNTSDFCSKKEKNKVHPELQNDTAKFKVYNSTHQFFDAENQALNLVPSKFSIWVEELNLDNELVLDMIFESFESEFTQYFKRNVEKYELDRLFNERKYERGLHGYVSSSNETITECSEFEAIIVHESLTIKGIVKGYCDVEGYEYNPVRDYGEDDHSYIGEAVVYVEIGFSFEYDRKELPYFLELDYFDIVHVE